jgi:RHS repeat-associated protein
MSESIYSGLPQTFYLDNFVVKRVTNNFGAGFKPDVQSYSDYYPFGMLVPLRYSTANDYSYGFQGQEKDNEIKGEGNSLNYTFRMHDPRVGRFFAVDPLALKYPHNSPYAFSENDVIRAIELEGLEKYIFNKNYRNSKKISLSDGKAVFKVPLYDEIIRTSDNSKLYYFKWKAESRFVSNPENEDLIADYTFNQQEYLKINSPMSIQGADGKDGFDKINDGNIFGLVDEKVKQWKKTNWKGSYYTTTPSNLLNFKKASGNRGAFDFKYSLKLKDDTLYDINGTSYNKNEAGNFYWGYAAASLGFPIELLKAGATAFVKNQGRQFDEPWEVDAFIDGYKWYHSFWNKDSYDKTVDGNNIDIYSYGKTNEGKGKKK